jgi:hypothetical protein
MLKKTTIHYLLALLGAFTPLHDERWQHVAVAKVSECEGEMATAEALQLGCKRLVEGRGRSGVYRFKAVR